MLPMPPTGYPLLAARSGEKPPHRQTLTPWARSHDSISSCIAARRSWV